MTAGRPTATPPKTPRPIILSFRGAASLRVLNLSALATASAEDSPRQVALNLEQLPYVQEFKGHPESRGSKDPKTLPNTMSFRRNRAMTLDKFKARQAATRRDGELIVSRSLIGPLTVSAKVIRTETKVPALSGAAFNREAVLEKGIHVHWALPDSLTRAKLMPDGGAHAARFHAVPDVWLVIRFNPGPPIEVVNAKRSWRAWVVDSVEGTAVPLASWVPPTRNSKLVHTVAGMLPNGAIKGYPGWGLWSASQGSFEPAQAAYYPAARARFGFYDNVTDLPATGNVSYVVVGWFADRNHDPLYMAKDKLGLLNDWKISHHLRAGTYAEVNTMTPHAGAAAVKPAFSVSGIAVKDLVLPAGKEVDFARAVARGGTAASQSKLTEAMSASFPVAQAASSATVHGVAGFNGPTDLVIHGSCVEVPLSGSTTVGAAIKTDDIRLFPSVRRAMADVAAANTGSAEQVDAVEMMLDDVESMKSSLSGVLDMPGAAHAATFQNVPGKSHWYARLEVQPKSSPWQLMTQFDTQVMQISPSLQATGQWPQATMRSLSNKQEWMRKVYAPALVTEPPVVAPPQLTDADYATWRESVMQALTATINAPQAAGKAIHPTLIQVLDRRKDAQPTLIGKTAGRGGSDGAAWWVDVTDVKAMNELLLSVQGAKVILPNVDNLLELPGQRWNRPWSPHVVLYGTGRSFKAGADGRFRADGYLKTRQSGETVMGLSVGSYARVNGKDIIDKPNELFSKPGLPSDVRALVHESLLLDTESAGVMAQLALGRTATRDTLALAHKRMKSAVRGLWLARDQKTVLARNPKLSAVAAYGTYPSDVAMSPWQDPRDPLFVDVNYSHPFSTLAADWVLDQDRVEMRAAGPAATNPAPGAPPAGMVEVIEERTLVTATVAKVLESTLVTKKSADVTGTLVTAQKPPKGVTADTFKQMDIISAPLTAFDSSLVARGHRERSGALRLNRLQLVDMFGLAREWKSATDPLSAAGDAALTYWTELAPRLPYWSRLLFRLQQAANPGQEATPLAHPVCGILVPDFIEHALEVFDGNGQALGQLTTDRPRFGGGLDTPGASLQVELRLAPVGRHGIEPAARRRSARRGAEPAAQVAAGLARRAGHGDAAELSGDGVVRDRNVGDAAVDRHGARNARPHAEDRRQANQAAWRAHSGARRPAHLRRHLVNQSIAARAGSAIADGRAGAPHPSRQDWRLHPSRRWHAGLFQGGRDAGGGTVCAGDEGGRAEGHPQRPRDGRAVLRSRWPRSATSLRKRSGLPFPGSAEPGDRHHDPRRSAGRALRHRRRPAAQEDHDAKGIHCRVAEAARAHVQGRPGLHDQGHGGAQGTGAAAANRGLRGGVRVSQPGCRRRSRHVSGGGGATGTAGRRTPPRARGAERRMDARVQARRELSAGIQTPSAALSSAMCLSAACCGGKPVPMSKPHRVKGRYESMSLGSGNTRPLSP